MKEKIFLLIFVLVSLCLTYNVLTQSPPAIGGGGGGGFPSSAGCWNFNEVEKCENASDTFKCKWHPQEMMSGPTGWCEEKGCWGYWYEPDCKSVGCEWDSNNNFCYKKGCWEYSNQSSCALGNCSWEGFGYCYEVGCWDFTKKSTCLQANVTHNINCKWNDMGTVDTTDDYCYEIGPWEYSTNDTCVQAGFDWGAKGGWCSDIGCWNFNTKNICNAAEGCYWDGWEQCRNRGCQDLNTQPACESIEDTFNCTWDISYNYCKELGCWNYQDQTNCTDVGETIHPVLDCQWNINNNYCYEPNCWDYKTQTECDANSADSCYWDSQWGECRERGCWDYGQNQTVCEQNPYDFECNWKIGGYCYMPGCWYYNTSELCNVHSDKCTWDGQYCYEQGCWNYYNQTVCVDVGNTIHSDFDCRWKWHNESDQNLGGYCYKPECWNYVNETNCTSQTDELTCIWDSSNKVCYKIGCWEYSVQENCTNIAVHPGLSCSWDNSGQYCYEQGCWNYWQNQSYCELQSGCLWQSNVGWCEENTSSVDCWAIKDNSTCFGNSECIWEVNGGCNKEGCWKYGNQIDCEAHSLDKRCVWDSNYNSCYEKGCWEFANQSSCAAANCLWDLNGWCYQEGCWKYNNNDTCVNESDTMICKWEDFEYCYEQGCWDYADNATCAANACMWQESGWCEGGGDCWNYYNNETGTGCEAHPGCVWKKTNWCDRKGPWIYPTNETCAQAGFDWKTEGGWCSEKSEAECWRWNYNQSGCEAETACMWQQPNCVKRGCWEYMSDLGCNNAPEVLNCEWKNKTMPNGWCEELGCWNFWNTTECSQALQNYDMNCMWQTFGFCEERECWSLEDEQGCTNTSDILACSWNGMTDSFCQDPGCSNYYTNETCVSHDCTWNSFNGDCYFQENCWNKTENETCIASGCKWHEPGMCEGKYGPSECWKYSNSTECAADDQCRWKTGWCNDDGCYDYHDSTNCTNSTIHSAFNCTWRISESGSWCEEEGCWNYNDQSSCSNVTLHPDLTCTWHSESWNPNGGWCEELGCWNFWDNDTCINNGCEWQQDPGGFGGWCMESGCWGKTTKAECDVYEDCSWKTESHCEWAKCWMFDNKTLQGNATEDKCVNNTYGLNCTWDENGGWCNEYNIGCAAYDGNKDACKLAGFCLWNEVGQVCDSPGADWLKEKQQDKKNPGCWMFDYEEDYCDMDVVDICTWDNTTGKCSATKDTGDLGIQCLNILDSTLCEKIPVLSTCCVWKNNKCQSDLASTKCWENFQPPPEGATFCEDYNAYKDQSTCEEIAGDPWYMPCKWGDKDTADTSDDRCVFRKNEKFKGEDKGCEGITSNKDCEFAGCVWKQEYYCEGDNAIPYGWCEEKIGAGSKSCDAECWACEFYDSSGTPVNSTNAQTACENSDLGYCEFIPNTNAPNGVGFCDIRNEIKFGMGECSADCMACEFKAEPQTACEQSSAQCKWVSDTTGVSAGGGWCYPKSEKVCSDDCFRCYSETECINYGGGSKGTCAWDSETKICKPKNFDKEICFDGFDNDGDGKFDCGDSDCNSDTFCGGGVVSDCWVYGENECKNSTVGGAEGCIWIVDPWEDKEWCGLPGDNCFLWDGNQQGCSNQTGLCEWFQYDQTDANKGFCDLNKTKIQTCFKLTTQGACSVNPECYWTPDPKSSAGGWCDPRIYKCEEKTQTQCEYGEWTTRCKWVVEDGIGKCKPACLTNQLNIKSLCEANTNCQWINGWCDPAQELGMNTEDCWKYSNDQNQCDMAMACTWAGETNFCDINNTKNWECQQMKSMDTCTGQCKWNGDQWNGWCDMKIFACGWYQDNETCVDDAQNYGGCIWKSPCECMWSVSPEHPQGCEVLCRESVTQGTCNVTAGCQWTDKPARCEPKCFDMDVGNCSAQGGGWCELVEGSCEPKFAMEMFGNMPEVVDLGGDDSGCGPESPDESMPDDLDICGFGLVDEPGSYDLGLGVDSLLDAAMCNGKEVTKNFGPNSPIITLTDSGTGKNTTKYYWYLDTDGSETGGCSLYHDSSQIGYEFFLKYVTKWENGNLVELKSAYRCENGEWIIIPGDLKISTWNTMACSEIGGPIIIIEKTDLTKFTDLYKPWEKIRIYMASGRTIESSPTDTAGPVFYKPGTIGATTSFDVKGFNQQGFVKSEDCFNGMDDDFDDSVDCDDVDCRFAPKCAGIEYTDDSTPSLVDSKVKNFPDSAFIKYDTDEPTNGTVLFYYNDSECLGANTSGKDRWIYDRGIIDPTMKDYNNWHDAPLDNLAFNPQALGYWLDNGTTYYYKIIYCDPSGNCGITGCLNFTTPSSTTKSDCPMCEATIKIPPNVMIDFGDGYETYDSVSACGGSGVKKNNTQMKSTKIAINGSEGLGQIIFDNTTIIDSDIGSPTVIDNMTTVNGYQIGYVGMESEDFNNLTSKISPGTCTIPVPKGSGGDCDKLWQCDTPENGVFNDSTCYVVEAVLVSQTSTYCEWKLIECKFSVYRADTRGATTTTTAPAGPGSGAGGAGGAAGSTTIATTVPTMTTLPAGVTTSIPAAGVTTTITEGKEEVILPLPEVLPGIPTMWMIAVVTVALLIVVGIVLVKKSKGKPKENVLQPTLTPFNPI